MQDFFSKNKSLIIQFLRKFFAHQQIELAKVNTWGADITERYRTFTLGGKMIRGCLTILGYEMFTNQSSDEVVKTAAAMEIFQSALLIHDDIMDRDTMRRGAKTIFAQYGESHFGESMGICAGDIGFFWGFSLLAQVNVDPNIKTAILSTIAAELTKVGVAQMQDVALGYDEITPNEKTILNLYRYKTARYTFSLPLMVGAMLAGQSDKTVKTLEALGEDLGIIFQLKDDQLDAESDLREGKKTLVGLYGEKRTDKKFSDLSKEGEQLIAELPINTQWRRVLLELLEYNKERNK